MTHLRHQKEKIVFVGDSRVRLRERNNIPQDYTAYPGKSEVFIPNFLLKEWMVASVFMVGFLVLVLVEPAPLGEIADPTNTNFIPMPDWYFLFLYQLLKYPYLSNQFVVLGTIVLPGLMFTALTIAPFLDRGPERRFYKRPIATSLMLVSIAAIVYLTNVSWVHYQHELEAKGVVAQKRTVDTKPKAIATTTLIISATNFAFDQDTYQVKAGSDVTIQLVSKEGQHGILIIGLDTSIAGGQKETIRSIKKGTYTIVCNVPCGDGHLEMQAKLIVS